MTMYWYLMGHEMASYLNANVDVIIVNIPDEAECVTLLLESIWMQVLFCYTGIFLDLPMGKSKC